jgi:LPS-assembly lipoprotein
MHNTQRRALLRSALAPLSAVVLASCGFALRSSQKFPFKSMYTGPITASPLLIELSRQVAGTGGVEVIIDQRQVERADVIFELLQEQREKVVAGRTSSGSVREFLLRTNLRFRLRTREGKELIPETLLVSTTDISYNETLALSKDQEEQMLYSNMGKDLVGQIVRRMAALTSL